MNTSQSSISSVKMPKLCQVCKRASFLKCMDCDVIYCSSKCQIKDWESHQLLHKKPKSPHTSSTSRLPTKPKPVSTKRESVQNRLKAVVEKENVKPDLEWQKKDEVQRNGLDRAVSQQNLSSPNETKLDFEGVSAKLEALKLGQQELMENVIEAALQELKTVKNYKRPIVLDKKFSDEEGFSSVMVTSIDPEMDGSTVYFVQPKEGNLFPEYKKQLNDNYSQNGHEITNIDTLECFRFYLVMTKIKNQWCRVRILSISFEDKMVGVECIDSGEKEILTMGREGVQFKIPQRNEMKTPALGIKVQFENAGNTSIEVGDVVKIKITEQSPYSNAWAVIKEEEPTAIKEEEPIPAVKISYKDRLLIEIIQIKLMHVGPMIKLMYIDGSKLEKGELTVCESVEANWDFYAKIVKEIEEYVENNPSSGYAPVVSELCLVKFEGYFYRAFCVKATNEEAKVSLLDYGAAITVKHEDIMAMPAKLLYTVCAHTCQVDLKSGRTVSDIDVGKSCDALTELNEFVGEVRKQGIKYVLTLDDSLFVFKR